MPWKRPLPTTYLLESWFLGNIKGKELWNNNIRYVNSKTGIVGSNWFLRIAINTKKNESFGTLIELLSVIIFDSKLKVDISNTLVSFDEVILLELRYIMYSMTADDLFYKL